MKGVFLPSKIAPNHQRQQQKLKSFRDIQWWFTLPETNSQFAPENGPFNAPKGNENSLPTIQFQGLWLLVSGKGTQLSP